MKRIFVVAISLALLVATPGLATADSTHQQAINVVIAARAFTAWRAIRLWRRQHFRSQPGHRRGRHPRACCRARTQSWAPIRWHPTSAPLASTSALSLPLSAEPRVTRVGFDSSGLVVYAFAGVGIKMPRSSGEQYKVGQKVLPSQALPGDLIFYGPEGSQSVALFIGNGADDRGHRSCRHGVAGTY